MNVLMPREVPDTFETLRASDGATFQMRVFKQVRDPMAPLLVCMPAMGTKGEFYVPLPSALFAIGYQAYFWSPSPLELSVLLVTPLSIANRPGDVELVALMSPRK